MGNYDFEEDSSDSDCDDFLREEIEALSRACLPTPNASSVTGNGYLSEDDDDDDDLELVRSIQERYGVGLGVGLGVANDIKPLASLPPPISDDDDDDYEFYCAIKERFSQHGDDVMENKDVGCRDESMSNDDVIGTSFGRESMDEHRDDVEREFYGTAEKEGFPLAAQTFIEAIKKNRCCQKFIRNKLLHMEAKIEEIKGLRKRLKTLRDYQVRCKKIIGRELSQKQDAYVQLISVHKERANVKGRECNVSAICCGPHENSYVACYKAALEKFPLSFHRDAWSKEDRQNLEKGIKRQYQEKLAHVLSSVEEPNGVDAMMLSIKNRDITAETIQCFSGEVNWKQLASVYLPCRSGEECEARWFNHENRLINSGDWTREEDIKLWRLIQKDGLHSWRSIAEKLSTNRTPYQCLARYQRSLNTSILNKDWTVDEDAQLCSAVESFGERNWQAVASVLVGRIGSQCSDRWKKILHPAREKVGKWGDDEDKRLRVAVTLFGKSWHRIAQFVHGRTQSQCRERWVNVLDPSLSRREWSDEEDMKLKEAVAEHGRKWAKVAACVPMRTDNQCWRRWMRLCPDEALRLKADRTIQRVALISNFVGREADRPTLRPNDFVSLPIQGPTNEQENNNGKQNRKRKSKVIEPTEKSSSICGSKSRKRKKSAEESDNEDTFPVDKRMTRKTGSKIQKPNVMKHKKQSKNKSRENKETNQNCEADIWDIPIRIMLRRGRGVKSKGNPQG